MRNWNDFRGKDVILHAGGTVYRGRMIEMTSDSILLKAETGYCEIPMERVTKLELSGAAAAPSSGILPPSPLSGFAADSAAHGINSDDGDDGDDSENKR